MNGTSPRLHRRAAAVASTLLVGALIMSGCSSSGSSAPTSGTGSSTGSQTTSSTASSNTSSSSAVTHSVGVSSGSDFCQEAKLASAAQSKNASALSTDSPASLEKFEKQTFAELQKFAAIAPSAVRGDLETIVGADRKLLAALEAAHYNIRKVNQNSISALESPQFTKAAAAIGAYLEKNCGISQTAS